MGAANSKTGGNCKECGKFHTSVNLSSDIELHKLCLTCKFKAMNSSGYK